MSVLVIPNEVCNAILSIFYAVAFLGQTRDLSIEIFK